jgi:hypothetical protein
MIFPPGFIDIFRLHLLDVLLYCLPLRTFNLFLLMAPPDCTFAFCNKRENDLRVS